MFSIGKNGVLNPFQILHIPQNIFPEQTTSEMQILQVHVYIRQWLRDEQGANLGKV